MIVKDIPSSERPREKAIKYGVRSLSNRELLAILIRNGYQNMSSLNVAEQILKLSDGISKINTLTFDALISIKGIKKVKAIELLACFELINRIAFSKNDKLDIIETPSQLYHWLILKMGPLKQEHFGVVFLDSRHHIIDYSIIFIGTLNASIIHPREIYKEAIIKSSNSIIIVHNHPSSDLTPSNADIEVTKRIYEVGQLMDIKLIDHIIVSQSNYFSFKKQGMLDCLIK